MNVVSEKSENTYSTTPLAEALSESRYRDGILFLSVTLRYHINLFCSMMNSRLHHSRYSKHLL